MNGVPDFPPPAPVLGKEAAADDEEDEDGEEEEEEVEEEGREGDVVEAAVSRHRAPAAEVERVLVPLGKALK